MPDGNRQVVALPFGEGLQRAKGRMIVGPNTFDDLRNVYQYDGKAQARSGMTETATLVDDVAANLDITLALSPLRAESAALGIGLDDISKEIWANRLTIAGTNPTNIGLFGTLPGTATWDPPIIILADTDGKCFIAHDEPNLNARLVTKYYDPFASPSLQTLQADLDGNGLADVYFRGVVRHLSYIFGWGFGNATPGQEDRADVVRVSTSGDPTRFNDEGFFEVGQRGEPVMVCRPAGEFLMVFKETETYQIFGYSPDTFGIRPSDTLFGCVSSRLAVSVAGTVFFWSVQGPRVTTGGASVDIAVPLDLDGPDPATLVAESNVQDAFAEYDPATRTVQFVWGQRVYALSIRDPNTPRWSYYELGEVAQCGAQFFATQSTAGGGAQPADGPEWDVTPFTSITPTSMKTDFDNVGATGGEVVEIWKRINPSGAWGKHVEVLSDLSSSQKVTVTGLAPITTYDWALRYRRGGLYNPSAVSLPPSGWPAAAQAQETTAIATPVPVLRGTNNGLWQVQSGPAPQITIDWTIPAGHSALQIEVYRQIRTEGTAATQDVDGRGIGPPDSADVAGGYSLLTTLAAGTTQFIDTSPTNHRWNDYQLRFVGGTAFSATVACWAGPDAPAADWSATAFLGNIVESIFTPASAPTGRTYCPGPTAPPANHSTEMWGNNNTDDPASNNWVQAVDTSGPYFTTAFIDNIPTVGSSDVVRVGIRHVSTCFGTIYPSYWAKVTATPNYRQKVMP